MSPKAAAVPTLKLFASLTSKKAAWADVTDDEDDGNKTTLEINDASTDAGSTTCESHSDSEPLTDSETAPTRPPGTWLSTASVASKEELKRLLRLPKYKSVNDVEKDVAGLHSIRKLPEHLRVALVNATVTEKEQTKDGGDKEVQRFCPDRLSEEILDKLIGLFSGLSDDEIPQLLKKNYLCSVCGQVLVTSCPARVLKTVLSNVKQLFSHKNANNVVQELIKVLSEQDKECLVDKLLECDIKKLTEDKYASRGIQLLTTSSRRLCQRLLPYLFELAKHSMGNFVVQEMLKCKGIKEEILRELVPHLEELEKINHCRNLVQKLRDLIKSDEALELEATRDQFDCHYEHHYRHASAPDWQIVDCPSYRALFKGEMSDVRAHLFRKGLERVFNFASACCG